MKKYITILLFLFISCTHEKDIQVTRNTWVLIDKIYATRWPDVHFYWLVWRLPDGQLRYEDIKEEEYNDFPIGIQLPNRDRK